MRRRSARARTCRRLRSTAPRRPAPCGSLLPDAGLDQLERAPARCAADGRRHRPAGCATAPAWRRSRPAACAARCASRSLHLGHGLVQPLGLHRLEHVVDGLGLEGLHRVLVVGGDEHQRGERRGVGRPVVGQFAPPPPGRSGPACGCRRTARRAAAPAPACTADCAVAHGGHDLQLRARRAPARPAAPAPAAARLRRSGRWACGAHARSGKRDGGAGAAAGGRPRNQARRRRRTAVARRSRTCVRPKPLPCGRWRGDGPTPVSITSQHQLVAVAPRAHGDAAAFDLGLQPVLDAVFHQRLQQQRRHRHAAPDRAAAPACSAGAGPCARPSVRGSRAGGRTRPAGVCVVAREASSVARR